MFKRVKVTIIIVTLIWLVFSIFPVLGATNFKDLKTSDWFYENVKTLVEDQRAIIKGYPDGTFQPLNKLTKDQFITMCVRTAGFNLDNATGYWAQNNIDKAYELKLIFKGEFLGFQSEITREEMAHIIARLLHYLEGPQDYSDVDKVTDIVLDENKFSKEYKDAISLSYTLGIITGYPDHTFRPQGVLSRSEASAVLVRVIDSRKRIAFDYDALYEEIFGTLESHLLGGTNWVNPVTASDFENAREDWGLMTSDLGYLPTEFQVENNTVSQQSIDIVTGGLMYDENGPFEGHLDDFQRLLQRRMPQSEVDVVMKYLSKKMDKYTYLEHDEVFFYLDNDRYLVRIDEVLAFENTQYEQAMEVNFNIWYRDEMFISKHEKNIVQIMPSDDTVIYR